MRTNEKGTALVELALAVPFLGVLFIFVISALNYTSAYVDLRSISTNVSSIPLASAEKVKDGSPEVNQALAEQEAVMINSMIQEQLFDLGYTNNFSIQVRPVIVPVVTSVNDPNYLNSNVGNNDADLGPSNQPTILDPMNSAQADNWPSWPDIEQRLVGPYNGNSTTLSRIGYDFVPVKLNSADKELYQDLPFSQPLVSSYQTLYYYRVAVEPAFLFTAASGGNPFGKEVVIEGMVTATRQYPLNPSDINDNPLGRVDDKGGTGGGGSSSGGEPFVPSDSKYVGVNYAPTGAGPFYELGSSPFEVSPVGMTTLGGSNDSGFQAVCDNGLSFFSPDPSLPTGSSSWYDESINKIRREGPSPSVGAYISNSSQCTMTPFSLALGDSNNPLSNHVVDGTPTDVDAPQPQVSEVLISTTSGPVTTTTVRSTSTTTSIYYSGSSGGSSSGGSSSGGSSSGGGKGNESHSDVDNQQGPLNNNDLIN